MIVITEQRCNKPPQYPRRNMNKRKTSVLQAFINTSKRQSIRWWQRLVLVLSHVMASHTNRHLNCVMKFRGVGCARIRECISCIILFYLSDDDPNCIIWRVAHIIKQGNKSKSLCMRRKSKVNVTKAKTHVRSMLSPCQAASAFTLLHRTPNSSFSICGNGEGLHDCVRKEPDMKSKWDNNMFWWRCGR